MNTQANGSKTGAGKRPYSRGAMLNKLYDITQDCTVRELEAMRRIVEVEIKGAIDRSMALHAIDETIRRKVSHSRIANESSSDGSAKR